MRTTFALASLTGITAAATVTTTINLFAGPNFDSLQGSVLNVDAKNQQTTLVFDIPKDPEVEAQGPSTCTYSLGYIQGGNGNRAQSVDIGAGCKIDLALPTALCTGAVTYRFVDEPNRIATIEGDERKTNRIDIRRIRRGVTLTAGVEKLSAAATVVVTTAASPSPTGNNTIKPTTDKPSGDDTTGTPTVSSSTAPTTTKGTNAAPQITQCAILVGAAAAAAVLVL